MPDFKIYEGEHAVRAENGRLKTKIARADLEKTAMLAEINRLRETLGEPTLTIEQLGAQLGITPVGTGKAPTPMQVAMAQAAEMGGNAQTFDTGECKVQISAGPGARAAPAMNPLFAKARAQQQAKMGRAPAQAATPIEPELAAAMNLPNVSAPAKEQDEAEQRMQLLEL